MRLLFDLATISLSMVNGEMDDLVVSFWSELSLRRLRLLWLERGVETTVMVGS